MLTEEQIEAIALKVADEYFGSDLSGRFSSKQWAAYARRLIAAVDAERSKDAVAEVKAHTGSLKDMAIVVWANEQPPIGTKLYLSPAIPCPGFALAPITPSDAMIDAGADAMYEAVGNRVVACYKAMIAAAGK